MPVSLPLSQTAFADALRKGLGRAFLQLSRHGIAGLEETLLDACKTSWVYDAQCEGTRGAWLWELASVAGLQAPVRAIVAEALESDEPSADCWTELQLGEIAGELFRAGDQALRRLYYRAAARSRQARTVERADGTVESAIVGPGLELAPIFEIDGLPGFLELVRALGDHAGPWSTEIAEEARESFGEAAVGQTLREAALGDPRVRGFLRHLDDDPPLIRQDGTIDRRAGRPSSRDDRTAAQLLDAIRTAAPSIKLAAGYWPNAGALGWGLHAAEPERRALAEALWIETDPRVVNAVLCAFQRRGLPDFDARLLALSRSGEPHVRDRAHRVLIHHPCGAARALALEDHLAGRADERTVDLVAANWRAGDETIVQSIAESFRGRAPDELHGVVFSMATLLRTAGERATAFRDLALFVWDESPCSNCRVRAAELLATMGDVPKWLAREAAHDARAEIRAAFAREP